MSSSSDAAGIDSRSLLGSEDATGSAAIGVPSTPPRETTPLNGVENAALVPSLASPTSRSKLSRQPSRIQVLGHNKKCVAATYGVLWSIYLAVLVLVIVAFYFLLSKDQPVENHIIAWGIGALAVAVAVPLALTDIALHLLHWSLPDLQKNYVRVIAMVPIYAIESWCALRFKEQALIFEALREMYEAYVIWSFFNVLSGFLAATSRHLATTDAAGGGGGGGSASLHPGSGSGAGGGASLAEWSLIRRRLRAAGKDETKLMFPLCCFRWRPAGAFLFRCSAGILQYVFVRILCTIATLILNQFELYGEGTDQQWSFGRGYIWITGIITVSQGWAMYCLVQFYITLKAELKPLNPVLKLAVVKGVVFFSFYQNLIIAALVHFNVIKPTLTYSSDEVAKGLADFIICIECALAAIAAHVAFGYKDLLRPEMAMLHDDSYSFAGNGGSYVAPSSAAAVGGCEAGDGSTPVSPTSSSSTSVVARHHGVKKALMDLMPLDIAKDTRMHVIRGLGIGAARREVMSSERQMTVLSSPSQAPSSSSSASTTAAIGAVVASPAALAGASTAAESNPVVIVAAASAADDSGPTSSPGSAETADLLSLGLPGQVAVAVAPEPISATRNASSGPILINFDESSGASVSAGGAGSSGRINDDDASAASSLPVAPLSASRSSRQSEPGKSLLSFAPVQARHSASLAAPAAAPVEEQEADGEGGAEEGAKEAESAAVSVADPLLPAVTAASTSAGGSKGGGKGGKGGKGGGKKR